MVSENVINWEIFARINPINVFINQNNKLSWAFLARDYDN